LLIASGLVRWALGRRAERASMNTIATSSPSAAAP
jgi:hypothetical protein